MVESSTAACQSIPTNTLHGGQPPGILQKYHFNTPPYASLGAYIVDTAVIQPTTQNHFHSLTFREPHLLHH